MKWGGQNKVNKSKMKTCSSFEVFRQDVFPIEELYTIIGGIVAEDYVQMDDEVSKIAVEKETVQQSNFHSN
jgi:hypothetical protein